MPSSKEEEEQLNAVKRSAAVARQKYLQQLYDEDPDSQIVLNSITKQAIDTKDFDAYKLFQHKHARYVKKPKPVQHEKAKSKSKSKSKAN